MSESMTTGLWKILFVVLIAAMSQAASADNNQQKQKQLKKEISSADKSLKNSRNKSHQLSKKVEEAEDKLNQITKQLHQTERKIGKFTSKLVKSNVKKKKLQAQTDQQKTALAQQMQALYTSGKQSHLRLLLKQDNPSDISRTVKYFEFMNKHRLGKIRNIKSSLSKVQTLQDQINTDTATLNKLKAKQSARKKELKVAVNQKEKALKKQNKVVRSKEQKLAKLKREEERLNSVIQQLSMKREHEENAREQQKQKKVALARQNKKVEKPKGKTQVIERHYVPNKPFSSLRGKLPWPVKGRLTQGYGKSRNSKQKWKGVILSAPAGSDVYAVARGKVEYSGRLKGYGYLVILRHDKNYRSLYAYNRAVFKKEGQIVKAGEIIAAVGSSGGQANSGLYFEIRKGTSHQNPAKWCR